MKTTEDYINEIKLGLVQGNPIIDEPKEKKCPNCDGPLIISGGCEYCHNVDCAYSSCAVG